MAGMFGQVMSMFGGAAGAAGAADGASGLMGGGGGKASTKYKTESAIGQSQAQGADMTGGGMEGLMSANAGLPAVEPQAERGVDPLDFGSMDDKQFEKYMYSKGMSGGLDFESMSDEEKQRYSKYLASEPAKKAPPLPSMGLSQSQGKDMSQGNLQGLMNMATRGRAVSGSQGLMG